MVDRTDQGGIITASSRIHDAESESMVFDNDSNTKWLTDYTKTGWIQFQFPANRQYQITEYSITSANDAPERDPKDWILWASNDGENWVNIDSQVDQSWTSRFQTRYFQVVSAGLYEYYKLDIIKNNGSRNLTGFAEMELLEYALFIQNPTPQDQAVGLSVEDIVLQWQNPTQSSNPSYNLYFSKSITAVNSGSTDALLASQNETSYTLDTLDYATNYYWRVDVIDSGVTYQGNTSQFSTAVPGIDCLTLLTDINNDCLTDINDIAILAQQWLLSDYQTTLIADIDKTNSVDLNDYVEIANDWMQEGSVVVINEIMAKNSSTLQDSEGAYPDWIELKNLSNQSINLQGWSLADSVDRLNLWLFPDVIIPAEGFLIVFASEKTNIPSTVELHASFKLDGDGEYLTLINSDGMIVHEFNPGFPEIPEDVSFGLTVDPDGLHFIESYFHQPTPGADNQKAELSTEPTFSKNSNTFADDFTLEINTDELNTDIRYTTDGAAPTESSFLYVGPIPINQSVSVRARVFASYKLPGPVVQRDFIKLASDIQDFSSDLPVIVLENFGTGGYSDGLRKTADLQIFEPIDGITQLTNDAELSFRAGVKLRGSSTLWQPKKNYSIEAWDQYDNDKNISPFNMPGESDWILYAPYTFDRALIRNAFIFELSNQIGRYAVRTRFCEVFVNTDGGDLTLDDYVGVYVFMEKIKRDKNRVDIEKLSTTDNLSPDITGGYMLKIDRADPGDTGFKTSYGIPEYSDAGTVSDVCHVYPKESDLSAAQMDWIRNIFIEDFETALYGSNFNDPDLGYAQYINTDSFIDHHWLNELTKNADGLRLSNFMYKKRNGKLNMGPIWDFDRTMGCANDNRPADPEGWYEFTDIDWYGRLFEDIDYMQKRIDRWQELRKNEFSIDNLYAIIDSMATEIGNAQVRNFDRWPDVYPRFDSWQGEVDYLKQWLADRVQWIDSNYIDQPVFVRDENSIAIANPNLSGTIYYTLDGSDPRLPGGLVSPDAFEYTISSEAQTLISANAIKKVLVPTEDVGYDWLFANYDDSNWSAGTPIIAGKTGGIGYDENNDYIPYISYDVEALMNLDLNPEAGSSCYIRIPFEFNDNANDILSLTLKIRFDDAFVAYLNGQEVARSSFVPEVLTWDAKATSNCNEYQGLVSYDISLSKDVLQTGENMLAIHGLNIATNSSDFLIAPELHAVVAIADNPVELIQSTHVNTRVLSDQQWSGLNSQGFSVGPVLENLRITELMYHPQDPNAEFVELQNIGTETINLNLVQFTNGIDFEFPNIELFSGEYILVVKNQAVFESIYGTEFYIAGQYLGSLANDGETIGLKDASGAIIHDFKYSDSWYDVTDGDGYSLTVIAPAANSDLNEKTSWRPGSVAGGSPGYDDTGLEPAPGAIVINEILAHSHSDSPDWVELYNTTYQPIDIGGWYLSDDDSTDAMLKKCQIPVNTIIPANGYVVFYEHLHFGNNFALSENGETLFLSSAIDGQLSSYRISEDFGASPTGVAFGRYYKQSTDSYNFVLMSVNTPGLANAYPKVGPVVISEIMYAPAGDKDAEYVELLNISNSPVTLYDSQADAGWKFSDDGGFEYYFPTDTPVIMAVGERILLIKDITAFGTVPAGVQAFSWNSEGSLSNAGEKIQLSMPGDVDNEGVRQYIRIDRVVYSDGSHPVGDDPWPTEADGNGKSLFRINNGAYGNDVSNWKAEMPTPEN
ncbi:MAG: lamin tail domain-containing protein [Phycisphaerae bacterium]|nr:lamin tail domain-containing protein [Phycisphaerae bacterium]